MLEGSNYALNLLREGVNFSLYRGREHGNPMPILAVAVTAEQPSPHNLHRLEHEWSLASELDEAWAVQPLGLTRHEGRVVLVLKDPGGEPLDQVIERHREQALDVSRFLRIAIGLAAALKHAHRRGLIHKDVKPANTIVNDSGRVWLTGFGIASQLSRERLAPEQTGRMNRSIDSRSDFYSLGMTLYELLTGRLPFTASDPMEWVHCHIARQPPPWQAR